MYHITCAGGYALPIKTGKFEVLGYSCPVNSTAAASQLTLVDADPYASAGASQVTDSAYNRTVIEKQGIANVDGNLIEWFPEPIKVRYGLALAVATNLKVGKMMVYAR